LVHEGGRIGAEREHAEAERVVDVLVDDDAGLAFGDLLAKRPAGPTRDLLGTDDKQLHEETFVEALGLPIYGSAPLAEVQGGGIGVVHGQRKYKMRACWPNRSEFSRNSPT